MRRQQNRAARRLIHAARFHADETIFNKIEPADVLYPPLQRDHPFRPGPDGDYIFYASRLTPIKRQSLAIEALRYADPEVRLVIAGTGDVPGYQQTLESLAEELGVAERVEFTGWISEEDKAKWMAGCCAALYLAFDEDSYGYVTLEAFHSHKPVITFRDSGGTDEVITDGHNGLIAEPTPEALAEAMERLWADRPRTLQMGEEARETITRHGIEWPHIIERLAA